MSRLILVVLVLCTLAACGQSGPPLTTVHRGDPTWTLPVDHLTELPN